MTQISENNHMADKIKRKKKHSEVSQATCEGLSSSEVCRMRFPSFTAPGKRNPLFTCTLSPLGMKLSLLALVDQGLQHHLA